MAPSMPMRVVFACSAWLLLGFVACARSTAPAPSAAAAPSAVGMRVGQTRSASPPPAVVGESVFTGMCDASAVVPLSRGAVLVADDEENTLRAYDADRAGAPTGMLELSQALGLPTKVHKDGRVSSRELDIEAATRLGSSAYFLTSHGRDSRGRLRKERLKFFEVDVSDPAKLRVSGVVYDRLLEDLLSEPRLAGYGLAEASRLPPKAPGGLNLEGMTARVEGGVWLGFRNPVPAGHALLVPLLNPEELVRGQRARLGEPLSLDLGGRGVRGLATWRGNYLIVAGATDSTSSAALFRWDGRHVLEPLPLPELSRYSPEALFSPDDRDDVLLLSDDGSLSIDGVACKEGSSAAAKRFRGLWVKPRF